MADEFPAGDDSDNDDSSDEEQGSDDDNDEVKYSENSKNCVSKIFSASVLKNEQFGVSAQ